MITIFCQNLFVGVTFSCFQNSYSKEKVTNDEGMQLWYDIMMQLQDVKPDKKRFIKPKKATLRYYCYNIVTIDNVFDKLVFFIILSNLLTMTLEFESSTLLYTQILEYLGISFTLIFILEALLKLIAFGAEDYFNESWNRFDFIVVITGIIDIFFSMYPIGDANTSFLGIFKTFQIIRILRIIRVIR